MSESDETGKVSGLNRPNHGCVILVGILLLPFISIWLFYAYAVKKSSNETFDKWYHEEYYLQEFRGNIYDINAFHFNECMTSITVRENTEDDYFESFSFDCACIEKDFINFISIGDSVYKEANSSHLTFINSSGESLSVDPPYCRLRPMFSKIEAFFWTIFNQNKHLNEKAKQRTTDLSNLQNGDLLIRGSIYGVADNNASLVLDNFPDSLRIDTLNEESSLEIYRDGEKFKMISPARSYHLILDQGHMYTLKFSHPSYVSKSFLIDATGISGSTNKFDMETDVTLLTSNVSTPKNGYLTFAVYDSTEKKMTWDLELYRMNMRKSLKKNFNHDTP